MTTARELYELYYQNYGTAGHDHNYWIKNNEKVNWDHKLMGEWNTYTYTTEDQRLRDLFEIVQELFILLEPATMFHSVKQKKQTKKIKKKLEKLSEDLKPFEFKFNEEEEKEYLESDLFEI